MFSWPDVPEMHALVRLSADGRILFLTRIVRMASYGLISVVLALYLKEVGLTVEQIGLLFTLTLLGSAGMSFTISIMADRAGRRRMLVLSALLMVLASAAFASTHSFLVLALAAIFGTISPSGSEVGPCQAVEQAALPQTTEEQHRTQTYAWYNLVGYLAAATGSLASGLLAQALQNGGVAAGDSYRAAIVLYGGLGIALAALFTRLSPAIEAPPPRIAVAPVHARKPRMMGLHRSRNVILKWSAVSMLDSLGGGMVMQSFIAYWFSLRFGTSPALLGEIFFGVNLLAGFSALVAARIARQIGLLNTMVFTHLPSNILLMLVPLMPSLPLAIAALLARFSLSQMDMPTRQSYLAGVVDPDERSAAAGTAYTARALASSVAPSFTGLMLAASFFSLPFIGAGAVRVVYDLLLLRLFGAIKPPEELAGSSAKR